MLGYYLWDPGLMLQKAFGFHEAQTAWAFLRSDRGGEERKRQKKMKKRNERGGTELSAPEASASATSAVSLPLPGLPGHKTQNLLCVWVSMGCPGTLWGWHCTASLPCLHPLPAGSSDVAGQHRWCQTWCAAAGAHLPWSWHWGRPALLGGLPCTPFPSPVVLSGQAHEGCVPREGLWVPRLCALNPVPPVLEHFLPSLVTKTPWDLICRGSRGLVCQRGQGWWNCPLLGDIPPRLPVAGLAEEAIRTHSCWRGGFQRCLARLSAS